MQKLLAIALGCLFLWATPSYAVRSCYLFNPRKQGGQDELRCTDIEYNTVTGGAYPTFSEAFNLNPASIPVRPTPLGVEVVSSYKSTTSSAAGSGTNFALIKGLQNFGTAVSSNSDNTFYSSTPAYGFGGTPYKGTGGAKAIQAALLPTINFGVATSVLDQLIPKILGPTLGAALRYNQSRGTMGYGGGFSLNSPVLSLGFSLIHEPETPVVSEENHLTMTSSLQLSIFTIDFSYLRSYAYQFSETSDSYIGTLGLHLGSLVGTLSYKRYETLYYDNSFMGMYALQWRVASNMQIGYLYNYIPLAHSFGAQILLQ